MSLLRTPVSTQDVGEPVEVFFSVIKKLYGEKIRNRLFDRMVLTVRARYDLYMMRQGCINAVRNPMEQ